MDRFSFLNAAHTAFFADLYEEYLKNPDKIEPSWRGFFQGFDFALANYNSNNVAEQIANIANSNTSSLSKDIQKEFQVLKLIEAYRTQAHLYTKTNPLLTDNVSIENLSIQNFGLEPSDLKTVFNASKFLNLPSSSLEEILVYLQNIYTQSIGIEYKYIRDDEKLSWIENQLQIIYNKSFSKEDKLQILSKLNQAVSFENFLHTKYVGQKRFSLEGCEALIPALDQLISSAANKGTKELVLGMAHRGRLNVLTNVFHKDAEYIFSEFDGKDYDLDAHFDGDVKYHLGYTYKENENKPNQITLNLAPNPSHLETVGAVIEGITRAKQDTQFANNPQEVLPIAIHGDAAIAGQGIVYEIVQMAQLNGYKTQGTIHIVLNNQVGFTTNYLDARSSTYCTDVAKVTLSPVLHVNADDAEAVVKAFLFALEYRNKFASDIFIDVLGYRKYGHNEGDEPRFTQPIMYKKIGKHNNPRDIYAEKLLAESIITLEHLKTIEESYKSQLDKSLEKSRESKSTKVIPFMQDVWKNFNIASQKEMLKTYDTSFNVKELNQIAEVLTTLPSDKKFISKINKLIADRRKMYFENNTLDWAMAELLAYGTLLKEGYNVRISGQDVERGTFSHRHAVIKTEDSEEKIQLHNLIANKKGNFYIYNSLLSEYGVLGFEYGYAMASPNTLTIWEAQFGDFSNGAQIMIDQYISSAEDKWNIQNGIVMLLPHGYENQGAEHSSARMERYLQLCAKHNMYVADVTTPANFFHLLRRQLKTSFRKPLIVFSPKSLLRHPSVVSKINDLANGEFKEVIDDDVKDKSKIKTLVFCTGKFYYDLVAKREELGREDVAIVRIEQLFPLAINKIENIIKSYKNVDDYVWAQEEPKNMGAYGYMLMNFNLVNYRLAASDVFSAPAAGSYERSKKRYAHAIAMVFDKNLLP